MGKFVIKKTNTGFNFALKATNGQIIGTSEVYTTKSACENGVASVQKNSAKAEIEDQTAGESKKNPKFELYTDKKGEYRFRLTAPNGENILASEGYTTKENCLKGIASVQKNAPDATVETEE